MAQTALYCREQLEYLLKRGFIPRSPLSSAACLPKPSFLSEMSAQQTIFRKMSQLPFLSAQIEVARRFLSDLAKLLYLVLSNYYQGIKQAGAHFIIQFFATH